MAAEFTHDPDKHIIIDSKVYDKESLSEEQTKAVAAINFSDQEIARQRQIETVCRMGRDRMVGLLLEDLEKEGNEVLHVIESPAEDE